jgi:hypothetical protein
VERAARGYKDVNLHAMRMIEPGGIMMTFSCSGHMSIDLFQKVIFAAALDAGRRVSFVRRLTAGPDHPVSMYCPGGRVSEGVFARSALRGRRGAFTTETQRHRGGRRFFKKPFSVLLCVSVSLW